MKLKAILFTALLMMSLTVVASAQTDDDDDRLSGGALAVLLLAVAGPVSGSTSVPVYDMKAGQPIRVRGGDVNGDGIADVIVGRTGSTGHVKAFWSPCMDTTATAAVRKGHSGDAQEYMTIKLKDVLVASTEKSWKNTCRLMTVEMPNRKRLIGKFRFR